MTKRKTQEVATVAIADLKPAPYNPRTMTKEQADALTESVRRFGLVDPIIANSYAGRENIVIGGHQRLKVAKLLGMKGVPVLYVSLPENKERELNLRLNKNLGDFSWDILAQFDKALLLEVGFKERELNKYFQLDEPSQEEPSERGSVATHTCPQCGYEWQEDKKRRGK